MIHDLDVGTEPCFSAVRRCAHTLTEAEFEAPSWSTMTESEELLFAEESEPHEPKVGWQLTDADKALMHSQHGPLAQQCLPTE